MPDRNMNGWLKTRLELPPGTFCLSLELKGREREVERVAHKVSKEKGVQLEGMTKRSDNTEEF